jgi:hypothetical protein
VTLLFLTAALLLASGGQVHAQAARPLPRAVPDSDGDGIADDLDNCPAWPNPGQEDHDENGIGSACECGDQDGSGHVDVNDLIAINRAIFEPSRVTPLCDTNHDHGCDVSDLIGANRKIFGAPAHCERFPRVADLDGDGVADGIDPCPTTLVGAAQIVDGCSATDLAIGPRALGGPVMEGLSEQLVALRSSEILADLAPALDGSRRALGAALFELEHAEPCSGARAFEAAVAQLEQVLSAGDAALARFWEERPVPRQTVDVDEHSSHYLAERLQLRRLAEAGSQARGAADAFSRMCASDEGPASVRGIVESVDAERRAIHFTSGETVVMAAGASFDGEFAEGSSVAVDARRFGGQLLGKVALAQGPLVDPVLFHVYDQCLGLRIAPYQPWPSSSGSWILHPIDGYQDTSENVEVEKGMRLGAQGAMCPGVFPGPDGADQKIEYRFKLLLNYKVEGGGWTTVTLAAALGSDETVALPLDMDAAGAALTAKRLKRSCTQKPLVHFGGWDCSSWATITTDVYALEVREKFGYCTAVYDRTTFDLGDASPQEWRAAQVVSAVPSIGPGWFASSFSAQGKKLVNGNPVFSTSIGSAQDFAIRTRNRGTATPAPTTRPGSCGRMWRVRASTASPSATPAQCPSSCATRSTTRSTPATGRTPSIACRSPAVRAPRCHRAMAAASRTTAGSGSLST